ncbi:protein PHLOEM PROTEIN 2-LIKE A8-like isoform X2 [Juglans regia]|uniref:Protein PHLOEM PROTEIN 2-LIKE A8-like isoform X2 n=1 Tax=Juglans regia TaxID=51240 RepID=A0A6P9EG09_JUGRE|nr:protein PHLOEM PROTEIN 2-LIKE A8-like isoform X2 [Juglans regia]
MPSSMVNHGASSSLSSSSIRPWNHDVFLNFRGEDVRQKFLSHLYHGLVKRKINTYIDRDLERGEEISAALFNAIEESKISIVVLSKNYAESIWCLNELLKILDCKQASKQIVLPIFYGVKPSEVRDQKGDFGKSFDKLGDQLKDNVKMLKWKAALEEVTKLSGFELGNRDESEFIQEIIQSVDSRIAYHRPLSVAKYPMGKEISVQIDELSGKKSLMLAAMELTIIWGTGETPQYWDWIPSTESPILPKSRFSEVALLRKVWLLDIKGIIETKILSPKTRYGAYFIYSMVDGFYGFNDPVKVSIRLENEVEGGDAINAYLNPSEELLQINRQDGRLPIKREDMWMEIEIGEFFTGGHGDNHGEVEMCLKEVQVLHEKSGLVVHGIELRPK